MTGFTVPSDAKHGGTASNGVFLKAAGSYVDDEKCSYWMRRDNVGSRRRGRSDTWRVVRAEG